MDKIVTIVLSVIVAAGISIGFGMGVENSLKTVQDKGFGALAGPDIISPYVQWGGVAEYRSSVNMVATSSVACSIRNPATATSTLVGFTGRITANGIAQNITFDVATSSTAYGSTTPAFIYAGAITGSAQKDIAWMPGLATTTSTKVLGSDKYLKTGESPYLVGPNDYVNLVIASGTPGTFASYLTGTCKARFLPL